MRHISLIFAALAALLFGGPGLAQTPAASDLAPRLEGEDMVIGAANAPITIIEYASLTCPHCAHFHADVLPKLKAEYVDKGLVKFVYRDFPLDRVALGAAQIARCLPPDRYFGFLDVLYKQQDQWASGRDGEAMIGRVKQLARLAGLPPAEIEACATSAERQKKVVDMRFAGEQQFQVRGTPTLIINGKRHDGSMEFADLDKVLRPLAGRS
jgi:protein-disulfide isomerase